MCLRLKIKYEIVNLCHVIGVKYFTTGTCIVVLGRHDKIVIGALEIVVKYHYTELRIIRGAVKPFWFIGPKRHNLEQPARASTRPGRRIKAALCIGKGQRHGQVEFLPFALVADNIKNYTIERGKHGLVIQELGLMLIHARPRRNKE